MVQDTNTPMRIPDVALGEEIEAPLPGGATDEEYLQGVNAMDGHLGEKPEPPTMDFAPDATVDLPVPISHPMRGDLRRAEVRELTGEDEEDFAKGRDSNAKIARLVARGTVTVEGEEVDLDFVNAMPIGDRDALMLAIRKVTYGDTLDLDLTCNGCGAKNEITIDLEEEVEIIKGEETASIPLRRGGEAVVRWPNGSDAQAVQDFAERKKTATIAEVNTLLLGRILISVRGDEALGEVTARSMKMPDRRDVVNFLDENQPGPAFDKLKHSCVECGRTSPLAIGYEELFR